MRRRAAAFAVLAALAGTGCQLTPNFNTGYELEKGLLREQPVRGSLAVRPFEEARPARYYSSTHRIWLTYVPLIPYVSLPYERLDESVAIISDEIAERGRGVSFGAAQPVAPPLEEYAYPRSFARAVADDLAASGLFEEVRYVEGDASGHRWVLEGVLRETPLETAASSYGLGAAGVLLWFLPIPMTKTTASAAVDLVLRDQESGEAVWQHTLASEISRLTSLYTSSAMIYGRGGAFSFQVVPPPDDAGVDRRSLFGWHFGALRQAMLAARPDLARALERAD